MKRNVESRLAKLEASTGAGDGGQYFIFEQNKAGETLEEFDKRVEGLIAEEQRNGCASGFAFKMIFNHGTSHGGEGTRASDPSRELGDDEDVS